MGSDASADVVLSFPTVSPIHAELRATREGWYFHDMGSVGGSFASGERIERIQLAGSQVLRLGDPNLGALIEFVTSTPAAEAGSDENSSDPLSVPSPNETELRSKSITASSWYSDPNSQRSGDSSSNHWEVVASSFPSAEGTRSSEEGRSTPYPFPSEEGSVAPLDWYSPPYPWPIGPEAVEPTKVGPVWFAPSAPASETSSPTNRLPAPPFWLTSPAATYGTNSAIVKLGRSLDNDIVIDDLTVSRFHAELREGVGGFEIVDLFSEGGTFVDGQRISHSSIDHGSIISIGTHLFRLVNGVLGEFLDSGDVTFQAINLSVDVDGNRRILNDISFSLGEKSLLAILGPSGAGKSTLLKALTGFAPATEGTVLYCGRDFYLSYDELRDRVGYVPQDDILHPQLRLRKALRFTADLRFPKDVRSEEKDARIDEVMAELGIGSRADLPIEKMAGGQRKRTSVALELLSKPSILFLDEPTTGLDPGYERSTMQVLRKLADGGRTVIVITHSVQSLELCDRVLFLVEGGSTGYFGSPKDALAFFGTDYPSAFQDLEARGEYWRNRFLNHPDCAKYVGQSGGTIPKPMALLEPDGKSGPLHRGWDGHQFRVLVRRYVAVTLADRKSTRLLLMQAPVITLLLYLLTPAKSLNAAGSSKAGTVLLAVILGATFLGQTNAIREVVKELAVYKRERSFGLSISAYVASKATVLGALVLVQCALLVFVGNLRQEGPTDGATAFFPDGRLELYVVVLLTGLSATSSGLLISALVTNSDKASNVLPVMLVAQLLFAGLLFKLDDKPIVQPISYVMSTRWGFAAAASTADFLKSNGCESSPADQKRQAAPRGERGSQVDPPNCDPLWRHNQTVWLRSALALVVLSISGFFLTGLVLWHRDPLRRG